MKRGILVGLSLVILVGVSGVFNLQTSAKMRKSTITISNNTDVDIPLLEIAFEGKDEKKKVKVKKPLGGLDAGETDNFDVETDGLADIIISNGDGVNCGGPRVQVFDGLKIKLTPEMICKGF
jgi:hypothetical protein